MRQNVIIREINEQNLKIGEIFFFADFYFLSRKLFDDNLMIQSLNRKTSKLKIGTQTQFLTKKWRETKEEEN